MKPIITAITYLVCISLIISVFILPVQYNFLLLILLSIGGLSMSLFNLLKKREMSFIQGFSISLLTTIILCLAFFFPKIEKIVISMRNYLIEIREVVNLPQSLMGLIVGGVSCIYLIYQSITSRKQNKNVSISVFSLILFCMALFLSCTEKKENVHNKDVIEKIIIQFHPSFISQSMILLDMSDSSVTFQRIGSRVIYRPQSDLNTVTTRNAPNSINYSLDKDTYAYIKDSIQYKEEDFTDREEDMKDGVSNTILYVFKDGSIKDVELDNSITNNQYYLITRLIELTEEHAPDHETLLYLENLSSFY